MGHHERQAFWQQQVKQHHSSGLSARQFTEQKDLNYHQFMYWRKKFTRAQHEQSLLHLEKIKAWLDGKQRKVMKGGKLHTAIQYCLNQWNYLTGYCQRGDLKISNVLAENTIRPFAIGRKNWLFADTSKGAHASAAWYSLIETAKLHGLNPQAYLLHVLEHLATAKTLEQLEQLLAWNVKLETPAQNRAAQPS